MSTQFIDSAAVPGPKQVPGANAPGADEGSAPPVGPQTARSDQVSISTAAQHLSRAAAPRPEEMELRLSPRELRRMMEPTRHEAVLRKRAEVEQARQDEAARAAADADRRQQAEPEEVPVLSYDRSGTARAEPQHRAGVDAPETRTPVEPRPAAPAQAGPPAGR